jgi:transposase
MVRPDHPTYRRHVLDPLGLVAGMCDELGLGEVLAQPTHPNPAMRDLTGGEAVNAMGLTGLGLINQARSPVPRFFYHTPTSRRMSPRVAPEQLHDDALGRTLDTLYASGGTALYSLMAVSAPKRRGLHPTALPLDTTSVHADGRDTSDEEPEAQVVRLTQGDSRAQRPDRNPVVLEVMVEHQAGIAVLMQPLSGNSRDAQECGIHAPIEP